MSDIPTHRRSKQPNRLYQRYEVKKRDPASDGPDDPNAIYFVLRLDAGGDDLDHIWACHAAAMTFAKTTNNEEMAADLVEIVAREAAFVLAKAIQDEVRKHRILP